MTENDNKVTCIWTESKLLIATTFTAAEMLTYILIIIVVISHWICITGRLDLFIYNNINVLNNLFLF